MSKARVFGIIGLALLLVVDLALVYLVIVRTHPATTASDHGPAPVPIIATPTATPTPTSAPIALGAPSRLLVPVDDGSAWRTSDASCGGSGAATLEYTDDGGATWTTRSLVDSTLTAVLAIVPSTDTKTVSALAADAGCHTHYEQSSTSGQTWKASVASQPSSLVYPARDGRTITVGGGTLATPCATVAAFAVPSAKESAVICQDASLHLSSDAGATWQTPSDVQAVAVVATANGYLIAAPNVADCAGLQIESVSAAGTVVSRLACLPQFSVDGSTALAASTGRVWIWSGASVLRSSDGGATWAAAP